MCKTKLVMDIITFRAIKTKLLRNLTPEQQIEVEKRISYTLSILRQETMSEEAVALIITDVVMTTRDI